MADLTGTTPANTYKGLLQVNDYTNGIAGNTGSNALVIQDGAGNATALAISTGHVGIGTTSPSKVLEVQLTDDTAYTDGVTSNSLKLRNLSLSADSYSGIDLTAGQISGGQSNIARIYGVRESTVTTATALAFTTRKADQTVTEKMRIDSDGNVTPGTDNSQDFGSASLRWDDIYATNTTIQSSDRELKQDIEELTEAETRVAQACKGLLRKYRWKSSVEEKAEEARIHFGIIAQDLEAAFAAEGLDAGRYGMFVKNTWWTADRVIPAVEAMEAVEAVYDEEGNEVSPAVEAVEAQPEKTVTDIFNNSEDAPEGATEVTQRGVRYSELLAFIIAAI